MSPLDDELRGALSSRTRAIDPSPDLLAGVERRARRMRGQRVAAGVAGSALAVGALGVGGPMLASSLTGTTPGPVDLATTGPSATPSPADRFVLDPADPWAYRGVPLEQLGAGTVEAVRVEYAAVRGVAVDDVALSPLYGQRGASPGESELFFVAQVDGAASWGVARSTEGGPQVVQDQLLAPGTRALPAALPMESVSRLVVVAAEATDVQYCPGGPDTCQSTGAGDGLGQTILDGDTSGDSFRVLAPEGAVVAEGPAPDGPSAVAEPEGPGTDTPVDVDVAPYALDLDDPWAYRGPAELTQHPDLGSQDERLFVAGGTGRDDGSWSQRPLLGYERGDGLSVVMVLHDDGTQALVTTTWQRPGEAARQSEQPVDGGQLLVQSLVPGPGEAGLLVALASPRASAVETDLRGVGEPAPAEPGLTVWELAPGTPEGSVFLYGEGDGLLYHSEPARRS